MTEDAPSEIAADDQSAAAVAHAAAHYEAFRALPDIGGTESMPTPEWLRLKLKACEDATNGPGGRWCEHLYERPVQPWIIALWAPGIVTCGECAPDAFTRHGTEEGTCDGCGKYFPQGLRPVLLQSGRFVVHGGACASCAGVEPRAPKDPPPGSPLHPLYGITSVPPLDVTSLTDPPPVNHDGPSCGYQVPCPPWPEQDNKQ